MKATKSEAKLAAEGKRLVGVVPKVAARLPKELGIKAFSDGLGIVERLQSRVKQINAERTEAVNAKDAAMSQLVELITRLRSTVKGIYGDDSTEYQLVGGTRRSDRKRPARRPKLVSLPKAA